MWTVDSKGYLSRNGELGYCWKCNRPLREKSWFSMTVVGYFFCDRLFCRIKTLRLEKRRIQVIK